MAGLRTLRTGLVLVLAMLFIADATGVADAQPRARARGQRGADRARDVRTADTRPRTTGVDARGDLLRRRADAPAGLRGADPARSGRSIDVTRDFRGRYGPARRGRSVLQGEARDHKYLLVGGFWGQEVPGYLKPNLRRLRDRNLDATIANTNTRSTIESNIDRLATQIQQMAGDGRKLVLVTHSMGGLVALETLARRPELKQHIRGVITIGTPYGGVDMVGVASKPIKRALKTLRTDPKILEELSTEGRRQFVDSFGHPSGVPILSVASKRLSPRSGAFVMSTMQKLRGVTSDGIVPTASQKVPGAYQIELQNMDHFESVRSMGPMGNYDPGALTEALVATLLSLPE